mmetsp:Transcript_34043/g.62656  ORF Transcript_34043/g.62656 Transcript_34043/m.62656 type:complete len:410 (+) Transcript_34043:117-1346(+)
MRPSTSSSANNSAPRYDLGINPPYQINYRAKRAGKHITASKRRITFQFGFSSVDAIASGHTEAECRGEEHEIVLIWSHITGKRQLFMDGREIHMSKAARGNTKFEYSWNIGGSHTLKIIANGTPSNRSSCQRQFDLELDGMSFFKFAKIYELGKSVNKKSLATSLTYSYRGMAYDAHDDDEEEEEPPMPEVNVTAVDLFDAQPSPMISPMSNYSSVPSLVGSMTSSTSTASSYDEFLPVEYDTQKSFESVSNEILCAYSNSPPPAAANNSAPSSSRALVSVSEEGMDQITKSMRNIVNLDDITTQPIQPIAPNSPSLNTMKQGGANWGLVGRAPTLSEMRDSFAQSPTVPTREPMKTHPAQSFYQTQPQALVAYQGAGAPSYGYYGAPNRGAPNMGHAPAYKIGRSLRY